LSVLLAPLPTPCLLFKESKFQIQLSPGTLDGIIDTVSAKHDLTALTTLLAPLLTPCLPFSFKHFQTSIF
jgi:hypothetical protein